MYRVNPGNVLEAKFGFSVLNFAKFYVFFSVNFMIVAAKLGLSQNPKIKLFDYHGIISRKSWLPAFSIEKKKTDTSVKRVFAETVVRCCMHLVSET